MTDSTNPTLTEESRESALRAAPRKGFYGWWIVFASVLTLFISSGIGFYGHGVIKDPLATPHGWSSGATSLAITIYFIVNGFVGMHVGRLVDKYGPRLIIVGGATVFGLALSALSQVTELWQLYAVYVVLAVGWCGFGVIPINTMLANWFIRKRGVAMSISMGGLSLGGMAMVPLMNNLIASRGLAGTLPLLGLLTWVVVIPTSLFLVKRRPADIGQFPDGDSPGMFGKETTIRSVSMTSQTTVWTREQALRTVAFWATVVAFFLALGGQVAFLMHQMSFLSATLGRDTASLTITITAGASVIGRLFLGSIADRRDQRQVAIVCFLIQGTAVLALAFINHPVVLFLGTFGFGFTMGGVLMMQSLIVGKNFGMVSFGLVYGWTSLFAGFGSALGPTVAGLIFDATRSYQIAFVIFASASLIASFIIYFAKPPKHPSAGKLSPQL